MTALPDRLRALPLRHIVAGCALGAVAAGMVWVAYRFFPYHINWYEVFRPATLEFLAGRSPYNVAGYYNPPWALLPLVPFALLPARLGSALLSTTTFFVYAFVAYRMGAKPLAFALFLFSPYAVWTYLSINLDWLVALGFILPPQIGLFFILMKPQAGFVLALYWLFQSWREGGMSQTTRVFTPVAAIILLSALLYGPWFLKVTNMHGIIGDVSMFPYAIPFGLALAVQSIRRKRMGLSIVAAPLLSPYVGRASLSLIILGFLPSQWEAVAAALGLWATFLLSELVFS